MNIKRWNFIRLYPAAFRGNRQAMGFPKGSQERPFGRRPRGAPAQAKSNQEKNTPQQAAGIFIAIILWIAVATVGRLLPHPVNFTPMISLSLFAASFFSRKVALFVVMITIFFSDFLLSLLFHYPLFGSWSFFTYSAWCSIAWVGFHLQKKSTLMLIIIYGLFCSLGFWLWTNFGVWLLSGMYAHNGAGIFSCYIAALPFLKNSLLGTTAWSLLLYIAIYQHSENLGVSKQKARRGYL